MTFGKKVPVIVEHENLGQRRGVTKVGDGLRVETSRWGRGPKVCSNDSDTMASSIGPAIGIGSLKSTRVCGLKVPTVRVVRVSAF